MQTPTGEPIPGDPIPGDPIPSEEPAAPSNRRHSWSFIVSPYYLSALGVAVLVVGAFQQIWPLLIAGAILTAIAIAGYVAKRR